MASKFLITLLVAASYLRAIAPVFAQERIRIAWAGASPANAAIWVLQGMLHRHSNSMRLHRLNDLNRLNGLNMLLLADSTHTATSSAADTHPAPS